MHESDSSRHYGRHWHHAEANANSVSECIKVHGNVAHLCIELAELFRCPFVNFLLKVRDEAAEFPDSSVAAFPTSAQSYVNKTNKKKNIPALQVLNVILVEPIKFAIQIYVIRIFFISTMFVGIGHQVFDLSADKDHLAYSASEAAGGGCIPDKCQ
jgi:hypothetical protein